ncbi:hypothetical protein DT019_14590 [Streptomyces sp. SDr-06]|uniref:WhiB family transcriptional regulator n=1 Tax=Streptomyces sp. SDr-06 TaxID=2267702 RepID=UPI000DE8FAF4|nr:WhiB family transcriptional regulator [Streptomyces sp. SDr-06]RCH68203.1 hypothetical protein DT019_14590 [Streptomyces sp. SDr-06]
MPAPVLVRAPSSRGAHPAARHSGDWRTHAACIGLPDRAVFAGDPEAALPALRACDICPVRRSCLEAVAPRRSWFDGVSGGRLWRNGRPVRIPDDRSGAGRPGATPASSAPGRDRDGRTPAPLSPDRHREAPALFGPGREREASSASGPAPHRKVPSPSRSDRPQKPQP